MESNGGNGLVGVFLLGKLLFWRMVLLKEFAIKKGVRQCDPLSPFLFIIVMKGLNISLNEAYDRLIFHGISLPHNGPNLSCLMYGTMLCINFI